MVYKTNIEPGVLICNHNSENGRRLQTQILYHPDDAIAAFANLNRDTAHDSGLVEDHQFTSKEDRTYDPAVGKQSNYYFADNYIQIGEVNGKPYTLTDAQGISFYVAELPNQNPRLIPVNDAKPVIGKTDEKSSFINACFKKGTKIYELFYQALPCRELTDSKFGWTVLKKDENNIATLTTNKKLDHDVSIPYRVISYQGDKYIEYGKEQYLRVADIVNRDKINTAVKLEKNYKIYTVIVITLLLFGYIYLKRKFA